MSTAITKTAPSKAEVFIGEVLPPERLDTVLASLPSHVKPERFQRNLVIAVTQHPKLLECDPSAVFNEVSKAAALGLYLDPQLGEAYLITGWDSRNNRPAPQLRLGYRGLIKLARQSGAIATVYAHEVCKNDVLDISLGDEKKLVHKPDYFNDRGEVGMYYAVVHFSDGTSDFEPMSLRDIHRIRDRSDGWKAFKAGKIRSTPWASDEAEMAKKTVLRRLMKRIPQSPELAEAIQIEDADYAGGTEEPARLSLSARLASGALPAPTGFSAEHVGRELGDAIDSETGEITVPASETGGQTSDGTEPSPKQDSGTAPPLPPESGAGGSSGDSVAEQESAPGSAMGPALDTKLIDAYSNALFRAGSGGPKSLKQFDGSFWQRNTFPESGTVTGDAVKAVYAAHLKRVSKEIGDDACRSQVAAIVKG